MSAGGAVPTPVRVVLVTGLSGAGKASILRALEDLGYEAIDNPPLELIEEMVTRMDGASAVTERRIAVGVDARSRGFDAEAVLSTLARLRAKAGLRSELVFASAEQQVLLRRYTETRRRHPLSPTGSVAEGIAAERALTDRLYRSADVVIDTSDLALSALRQRIDNWFGQTSDRSGQSGLSVALVSFAFPAGLPREADMVFDVRFLKNPHYIPELKAKTGHDPAVAAYVETDPDFARFFGQIAELVGLVLPRFVEEGKKYATIAVGCSGGRHRSVHIVERLAARLAQAGWRVITTHRELTQEGSGISNEIKRDEPRLRDAPPVQAQEA
jgi:UPF0042 nucleotide-binding protein